MAIARLFLKASAVNAATAVFNLIGTVLLVRWFGAGVYANYLVDLAYISLVLILLEIVPSNYSVFRVQDEPDLIFSLAALAVVSVFVLVGAVHVMGQFFNLFHAGSIWIAPYAGLMAIKRYLDIRLQSAGRLKEYFGIELNSAVIRVVLLAIFFILSVNSVDAVWASLACATFMAQLIWFIARPDEFRTFRSVVNRSVWTPLIQNRALYRHYYLGIAIKRLRDNLVPILASNFFTSREALGAFFLAYRGLQFTLGQVRIIENLLNHRHTLASFIKMTSLHKAQVAIVSQLVCIVASIGLVYAAGVSQVQILPIIYLSFIIWIYVYSMIERAKAYSSYETSRINSAMIVYCIAAIGAMWIFKSIGIQTLSMFILALIVAEAMSFFTMYFSTRGKNETIN
jgi:hypothetical protein